MEAKPSLLTGAGACLLEADPEHKCRGVEELYQAWQGEGLTLAVEGEPVPVQIPGRPPRPRLVHPREVTRRKLNSAEGRAALVHAVAHIEFNAINLALDAVQRFRGMPRDYYGDWLRVAFEEASHFRLLTGRLGELGHGYGDFPAHNGLWEMAVKTAHDPLLRMALVPRVLEARGLDVTPGMMTRLEQAGDRETVAILAVILREEEGHVAIGSRWFRYLCDQRGLAPEETFRRLLAECMGGPPRGPFNHGARERAGFSTEEMAALEAWEART